MGKLRCQALILSGSLVVVVLLLLPGTRARSASVSVRLGPAFGEFLVSAGGESVSLSSAVSVEQKLNSSWVRAQVTNFYLRDKCDAVQPPRCRKLAANQTLQVMPWTGNYCSSQCPAACRLDGPAPAGVYRFSVTSCDNSETFVSPEFHKKQ